MGEIQILVGLQLAKIEDTASSVERFGTWPS
jgi:hypothetical protein